MDFRIQESTLVRYCRKSGKTRIRIPGRVRTIGAEAFYWRQHLTDVEIPAGVTTIGPRAFYACRNLSAIRIPDGVTEIGEYAFAICGQLESITLPASLQHLGQGAFLHSIAANVIIPDALFCSLPLPRLEELLRPGLVTAWLSGDPAQWPDTQRAVRRYLQDAAIWEQYCAYCIFQNHADGLRRLLALQPGKPIPELYALLDRLPLTQCAVRSALIDHIHDQYPVDELAEFWDAELG